MLTSLGHLIGSDVENSVSILKKVARSCFADLGIYRREVHSVVSAVSIVVVRLVLILVVLCIGPRIYGFAYDNTNLIVRILR